ncbi:MAG: ABC transporter ATP-binding protein [Rhodobacterales bacterium]|nr:ABC transporter ATP-binding protein [Rhodobacterales bacterium]
MLEVSGLTRTIGRRAILDGLTFRVEPGRTAVVLGPSGSGKTTLLRLVMGLERPDGGTLAWDGRALSGPDTHVAPQDRGFAMVFQDFTLFPHLDVMANVTFGVAKDDAAAADRVAQVLDLLEIPHLTSRRIDNLSGGEQQRVALARALATAPKVLLLDEPFSNIDHMLRERLYGRVRDHLAQGGITTVIATHDHKEAFSLADHILVLRDGRLIDSNPPRAIYGRPADAWVAAFFGAANLLSGADLKGLDGTHALDPAATYLVRPEDLAFADSAPREGTVESATFLGFYEDVRVRLDDGPLVTVRDPGLRAPAAGRRVGLRLRDGATPHPLPPGDTEGDRP